jgi:hypothetical protein
MKKYNHVNELAQELNEQGFEKDKDVTCMHGDSGSMGSLSDSHGNQLISCDDCKRYYILEGK